MSIQTLDLSQDTDPINISDPRTAMPAAANSAYDHLIQVEGLPADEVHRMQVCYEAAALITKNLLDHGWNAHHETHGSADMPFEQNYSVLVTPTGEELIADATWQQFLPREKQTTDLPKVLVGTRSEVLAQLREFGVADKYLPLWQADTNKMDPSKQKTADLAAEEAADDAWARLESKLTGSTRA